MKIDQSFNRDSSVLVCFRVNDITIQAWCPFQKGFLGGPFLGDYENYGELNDFIKELAKKYEVIDTAIATALWITRHPANIQVVLESTNKERVRTRARDLNYP